MYAIVKGLQMGKTLKVYPIGESDSRDCDVYAKRYAQEELGATASVWHGHEPYRVEMQVFISNSPETADSDIINSRLYSLSLSE